MGLHQFCDRGQFCDTASLRVSVGVLGSCVWRSVTVETQRQMTRLPLHLIRGKVSVIPQSLTCPEVWLKITEDAVWSLDTRSGVVLIEL